MIKNIQFYNIFIYNIIMSDSEIIPFITLINSFTEVSEINRRQIISKFDLLEERKQKNEINNTKTTK